MVIVAFAKDRNFRNSLELFVGPFPVKIALSRIFSDKKTCLTVLLLCFQFFLRYSKTCFNLFFIIHSKCFFLCTKNLKISNLQLENFKTFDTIDIL